MAVAIRVPRRGGAVSPRTIFGSAHWGRMSAIRPVPVIDALLAATAKVYGLTLVTRNEADVAGLNVDAPSPFAACEASTKCTPTGGRARAGAIPFETSV